MAVGYARYPQNQGLYNSVEQLRQLNAAAASRPVQPYQAQGLVPPRTTYGGAYGNPGTMPMQAAPRAQGLMAAPTDQQGYQQQMGYQNPMRAFGGLLPTMVSSPS